MAARTENSLSWLQLWLSFRGRASVRDVWLRFVLPWFVIMVVLGHALPPEAFVRFMPMEEAMAHPYRMITPLSVVFAVVANLSALAVGVKRCHDRDRSGWFLLIQFIPLVGELWLFVELGFLEGTLGPNRFGPDPLK